MSFYSPTVLEYLCWLAADSQLLTCISTGIHAAIGSAPDRFRQVTILNWYSTVISVLVYFRLDFLISGKHTVLWAVPRRFCTPRIYNKDIERVQKRCLRIIFPQLSYSEALDKSGLNCLDTRREEITKQIFRQIKSPTHPLHYLIPPPKVSSSQVRWY